MQTQSIKEQACRLLDNLPESELKGERRAAKLGHGFTRIATDLKTATWVAFGHRNMV
jgi:hypothetical protein